MTPAPRREDPPDTADLRERLARLEAGASAHERASAERHAAVLAAVTDLRGRLDRAEERAWRTLAAVGVLAAGGGAGGVELAKLFLGGG